MARPNPGNVPPAGPTRASLRSSLSVVSVPSVASALERRYIGKASVGSLALAQWGTGTVRRRDKRHAMPLGNTGSSSMRLVADEAFTLYTYLPPMLGPPPIAFDALAHYELWLWEAVRAPPQLIPLIDVLVDYDDYHSAIGGSSTARRAIHLITAPPSAYDPGAGHVIDLLGNLVDNKITAARADLAFFVFQRLVATVFHFHRAGGAVGSPLESLDRVVPSFTVHTCRRAINQATTYDSRDEVTLVFEAFCEVPPGFFSVPHENTSNNNGQTRPSLTPSRRRMIRHAAVPEMSAIVSPAAAAGSAVSNNNNTAASASSLHGLKFAQRCDMWNLGIILFQLFAGGSSVLFKQGTWEIDTAPQSAFANSIPPEIAQAILIPLLERDPLQRMTVEQLVASPVFRQKAGKFEPALFQQQPEKFTFVVAPPTSAAASSRKSNATATANNSSGQQQQQRHPAMTKIVFVSRILSFLIGSSKNPQPANTANTAAAAAAAAAGAPVVTVGRQRGAAITDGVTKAVGKNNAQPQVPLAQRLIELASVTSSWSEAVRSYCDEHWQVAGAELNDNNNDSAGYGDTYNSPRLLEAALFGNMHWLVLKLLHRGAKVTAEFNEYGFKYMTRFLARAVVTSRLDVVDFMVKSSLLLVGLGPQASPDAPSVDARTRLDDDDLIAACMSALTFSLRSESTIKMTQLLLKHGASPRKKDKCGNTPMMTCAIHGNETGMKLLWRTIPSEQRQAALEESKTDDGLDLRQVVLMNRYDLSMLEF